MPLLALAGPLGEHEDLGSQRNCASSEIRAALRFMTSAMSIARPER
jgi:hypothetical protein